jgi:mono/diheme cytochrome c family protein
MHALGCIHGIRQEEPNMKMKKVRAILAMSLLFIAGCSDSISSETTVLDGQSLYEKGCLSCHGTDLKGGAGPAVVNTASKYSEEEVLNMINNGIGIMPGNILTEEQAQIVTEWLMEK